MWPSGGSVRVPFERPPELGTRTEFTEAEHAARMREMSAARVERRMTPAPVFGEVTTPPRQSSLVVDPEDGRLPPMTADGQRRARAWRDKAAPTYLHERAEDFRPYDRCISRGLLGSAFPNIYSSAMWILQIPGFVVISHEMVHETRVIPLDGSPHVSSDIRLWMGDSRGRWEGDSLVVETTNFNGRTGSYARNGDGNPTSEALRVIERFRLTDIDTLRYEARIEDHETWTRPWTVAFSMPRDERHVIFEYACHEGNYAITNLLRIARAAEVIPDGR